MATKRLWGILAYSTALFAQLQANFRADVTLVRVPCAVTDANGGAVRSLGRDDFVLFEDGVRQTVNRPVERRSAPELRARLERRAAWTARSKLTILALNASRLISGKTRIFPNRYRSSPYLKRFSNCSRGVDSRFTCESLRST